MHSFRMLLLAVGFVLFSGAVAAQNAPPQTTEPQPGPPKAGRSIALALQSMDAQTAGSPINDVTLTGTITLASGPNAGSGPVTLSTTADGKSQITMNLPSGQQTEVRAYSRMAHTGTWTGPDGSP